MSPSETPAVDFEAITADGDRFRLSDHRGELVVINFWATWCGPCIEEIPDLVSVAATRREQGVIVVGISIDEEGFDVIDPFVEKYGITYPILHDEGTIQTLFGELLGVPTTIIIGRDGAVAKRYTGAFDPQDLRDELDRLMKTPAQIGHLAFGRLTRLAGIPYKTACLDPTVFATATV